MIGNISTQHNSTHPGRAPAAAHAGPRLLLHSAAVLSMAGPRRATTGQRHQPRNPVPIPPTAFLPPAGLRQRHPATPVHKSRQGASLAAHHSWHKHAGKQQAGSRHESGSAPGQGLRQTDSRDSFKQEAWFISHGGQLKRVTKHQARKQGWSGPAAMQAALLSRLDAKPSTAPVPNPDRDQRVLPDAVDEQPTSRQLGASVQKRSARDEDSGSADEASSGSRKEQPSSACTTRGSYLISYIGCTPVQDSLSCGCSSIDHAPRRCIRYRCTTREGHCDCYESWRWVADPDESPYGSCGYLGTAACINSPHPSSDFHSHCHGTETNHFLTRETSCLQNGTAGSAPPVPYLWPEGCSLNSHKSTGPAALLVAVCAGLGTACLTAGLPGCQGKKRQDLAPLE